MNKATLKQETMGLPAGAEVEILEPGPKVSVIRGPMNTRVSVANGLLETPVEETPVANGLLETPVEETPVANGLLETPVEEIPVEESLMRDEIPVGETPYPENPNGPRPNTMEELSEFDESVAVPDTEEE